MSVGTAPPKSIVKGDKGQDILKGVELLEISIVAVGASQKAFLSVVKSAQSIGQLVEMIKKSYDQTAAMQADITKIGLQLADITKDFSPSRNQDHEVQKNLDALGEITRIEKSIESICCK